MRRSETAEVFTRYQEIFHRLSSLLKEENPDDNEIESLNKELRSLLSLIADKDNFDLFSGEQKEFINSSKASLLRPHFRFGLHRSRVRSKSCSSLSSTDNSLMDSSATSDATKKSGAAISGSSADECARRLRLKELEFEAEDQLEQLAEEQRDFMRQTALKIKNQQRELWRRAMAEGLDPNEVESTVGRLKNCGLTSPAASDPPSTLPPLAHTPTKSVSDATSASTSEDRLLQILGGQKIKNSTPKAEDRYAGGHRDYAKFSVKFKAEVLDIVGVTDEEKYTQLQERTKDEARSIVDDFVYTLDRSVALKEALAALKFFYGKKTGSAQAQLAQILEGKEVDPNSVDQVMKLLREIQKMATLAQATGEAGFLEVDATVISLVKERFGMVMKKEFSKWSSKAEDRGEKVNVDLLISYLKDCYSNLNRTFSMTAFMKSKPSPSPSSASPSSSSSSSRSSPKPMVAAKVNTPAPKANVAAANVNVSRKPQQQRGNQPPPGVQVQVTQGCAYCRGSHDIEVCPLFTQLSYNDRVNFLFQERRCYKCFDVGHRAVNCKVTVWCYSCSSSSHHTLLHSDNPVSTPAKPQGTLRAAAASFSPTDHVQDRLIQMATSSQGGPGQVASQPAAITQPPAAQRQVNVTAVECKDKATCLRPIVAVRVEFDDGRYTDAYGLIDTGSNKTVVTKAFQEEFKIKTEQEMITLNALNSSSSRYREVAHISLKSLVDPSCVIEDVEVFVVDSIPVDGKQIPRQALVDGYPHLRGVKLNELPLDDVQILIGTDLAYEFAPSDLRKSPNSSLIAFHSSLGGWTVMGKSSKRTDRSAWAAFASFENQGLDEKLEQMFKMDFPESASEKVGLSQDDRRAEQILKDTCKFKDGRFEIGLLWKYDRQTTASLLPTAASEATARSRTLKLAKRLDKNPVLKQKAEARIQELIDEGYAEEVQDIATSSDLTWYLPGVVVDEPHKDKPRFCLDCRAESHGVSLNSMLLTGAGAVTTVYGAIQKARLFDFFAVGDVEAFYHRVVLPEEDRDVFRFFRWRPENNNELELLRMKANVFGASCSSTNATYAFRENAVIHGQGYAPEVIETVNRSYVDDVPSTAPSEEALVALNLDLIELCAKGSFKLTKFASNSRRLLSSVPEERRAKGFKDPDGPLPTKSFLGIAYEPEVDTFRVKSPAQKVGGELVNRRQVLSAVMGIFDPIGIISPFILLGKKFNQRLCSAKVDWSGPLPSDVAEEFEEWYAQFPKLDLISIPRSFHLSSPTDKVTLHVFVDATPLIGYGAVAYFTLDSTEVVWVSSRSRVSPDKDTKVDVNGSTPRVELQAAVSGIQLATQIQEEIPVQVKRKVFHTDSTCVYWWIQNSEAKYKVFIANRLNKIHLASSPQDWRHVPTSLNPADVVSRGATPDDEEAWQLFHQGPGFLRGPEEEWPPLPPRQDAEAAMVGALQVDNIPQESQESVIELLLKRKSSFNSVKRILCYVIRFIGKCGKAQVMNQPLSSSLSPTPSAEEMEFAEQLIVRDSQGRCFQQEGGAIRDAKDDVSKRKRALNRFASPLRQLDPFMDQNGVLRVWGRLENSNETWEVKHPIILPYKDVATDRIISHFHSDNGHIGVEFLLSELRRKFWIIKGRQRVKTIVGKCITCRKIHRRPEQQRMADLPGYRLDVASPFSTTAVDLAGPYSVKSGKSGMKVWIVLFTCARVRAVYLDLVKGMESSVFIDALQRFHAFYPTLRHLISDCGTNLIGARNTLDRMLQEWQSDSQHYLAPHGIKWDFIAPHSPHSGGLWERIVGVVKRTLASLVHGEMQFERFRTLVIIAAGIVNRRPLTRASGDLRDARQLTPAHFLLPAREIVPSSDVLPAEPLSGSQLRRSHDSLRPIVQSFWDRWKKEYIAVLQRRSKWIYRSRNLEVGDLVLVVDELSPREHWPLAVVHQTFPSDDGLVRRILLRMSSKKMIERDVRKVVLLEREGEGESVDDGGGGSDDGGGE